MTARSAINAQEVTGKTALSMATAQNELATINALLQKGADPNSGVRAADAPIIMAGVTKNLEAFQLLLDSGIDSTHRYQQGITVLHEAIASGLQLMLDAVFARDPKMDVTRLCILDTLSCLPSDTEDVPEVRAALSWLLPKAAGCTLEFDSNSHVQVGNILKMPGIEQLLFEHSPSLGRYVSVEGISLLHAVATYGNCSVIEVLRRLKIEVDVPQ